MDLTSLVFVLFVLSLYSYIKPVTVEYRNSAITNRSGLSKIALAALLDTLVFIFCLAVCGSLFYAFEAFY